MIKIKNFIPYFFVFIGNYNYTLNYITNKLKFNIKIISDGFKHVHIKQILRPIANVAGFFM